LGFTLKEGIDYTETFSPLSKKDSLRIIMALVVRASDVKTAFRIYRRKCTWTNLLASRRRAASI
jgi:hypothetical protein